MDMIRAYTHHKLLYHVSYWILLVCFFGFLWGTYDMNFKKTFTIELAELPAKLLAVYVTLLVLIPSFLLKKRYSIFLLSLGLLLLSLGLVQRAVNFYITEPLYFPERIVNGYFKTTSILTSVLGLSTVMIIPSAAKILKHWYLIQQKYQSLEREKLHAEIAFLKSQIHPHFLFNVLNSIYALTLKKSEKSSEVVLRLANLLHYMLYDANQSSISLKKEVEFVRNYISFEELRFENQLDIEFECFGDLNRIQISPLILLPFVENSFKHGTHKNGKNRWLKFELSVNDQIMDFVLSNSFDSAKTNNSQGIGLNNVRRRLELLYSNKYDLVVNQEKDVYKVHLQIQF